MRAIMIFFGLVWTASAANVREALSQPFVHLVITAKLVVMNAWALWQMLHS